jgi:AraC-like DNA-binding protein
MDRRIELLLAKLERETSRSWTTARLAQAVNLSSSRLRHLFKQETGKTPTQYLKELRLERSAILLRTTFFSIKEIASGSGLVSTSYFVREFKKAFGLSPTVYRNRFGLPAAENPNRRRPKP